MLTQMGQQLAVQEVSLEPYAMALQHVLYQVQGLYHLAVNIMVPILQKKELYAVLQLCLIIMKAPTEVVAHLD